MPPKAPALDPEALAISALGFLADDGERLGRFLAITGLDPANLRAAAREPGFLGAVLDYLMADESLLLAFAANHQLAATSIASARTSLGSSRQGME